MSRYAFYLYVKDLPELIAATNALEVKLRREGRPVAADRLLKAFGVLDVELEELSIKAAAKATELLRDSERHTRVRPDTQGGGGPRLEDSLDADPLLVLPGSVGVANEDTLDGAVPWWITNEVGSSARLGGRLFGSFFGGGDSQPPDSSQFRVHPLFEPGAPESGAGVGIITNPIPARRFILGALPGIEAEWKSSFEAIKRKFDAELNIVLGLPA